MRPVPEQVSRRAPSGWVLTAALVGCLPLVALPIWTAVERMPVDPGASFAVAPVPQAAFLACALGASVIWASALLHVAARGPATRAQVIGIVAAAVLLRALAWGGDPGLSDDRYRYVFEGAQVLEGQSPWAAAPADPERAVQRARWPGVAASVNHPQVPAAYPPVMQACSALGVVLGRWFDGVPDRADDPVSVRRRETAALRGVRGVFAFCDLAVLWPLGVLLARRGRSLGWLLAWAGSPLALVAFAGSGHFDAAGILALVAALALFEGDREGNRGGGRERAGRIALACGILIKFLPGFALAGGLCAGTRAAGTRGRRRVLEVAAWCALGVGLALGLDGGLALRGLGNYALTWESTPGLFRYVQPLFEWTGERDGGWSDPRRVARGVLLLGFCAGVLWVARRGLDPVRSAGALLLLFCLLSPTLHPWYVTWIVPFCALCPGGARLWLAAAAPLLWWPVWGFADGGAWEDPDWLFWIVVAPAMLCAGFDLRRARRR